VLHFNIEKLIKNGKLAKFVAEQRQGRPYQDLDHLRNDNDIRDEHRRDREYRPRSLRN
jgi:hypothetical protein